MNTLSLMLYAADLLEKLGVFLICGIFVALVWFFLRIMTIEDTTKHPEFRNTGIIVAILALLVIALPSKQTVYLIAASEAGERIAATPEAREMLELVRSRLKKALSDS